MSDTEYFKKYAMYIAMCVRNEMEDFHCKNLSDKQMKELNPIIRNAIYTAIMAFDKYDEDPMAKTFVNFEMKMIPDYWEKPKLTKSYKQFVNDKN